MNLRTNVRKTLQFCARCVQTKELRTENTKGNLGSMPIAQGVGERWHIDFFGPFPVSYKRSGQPPVKSPKQQPIQLLSDNIRENKEIKEKGQYVIGTVDAIFEILRNRYYPRKINRTHS